MNDLFSPLSRVRTGAGKSTLTRWNTSRFESTRVLDPDVLTSRENKTPVSAGRDVLRRARAFLHERQSFTTEITLAGRGFGRLIQAARENDFEIALIYIGTEDVEINLRRIHERVLLGGHDVPEVDVRRRFLRSFDNLVGAVGIVADCVLLDNSAREGYRLVAVQTGQERRWFEPLPAWAQRVRRALSD